MPRFNQSMMSRRGVLQWGTRLAVAGLGGRGALAATDG
jgi:hypothetical protein